MVKRNLIYFTRDSRGKDCALIFETEKDRCPRCGSSMQAFAPFTEGKFSIGTPVNAVLICRQCETTIEQSRIQIYSPTAPEVGVATVKAIASDIFREEEFNEIKWQNFVPHHFERDSSGKPIIIAKGASIHKSVQLTGPVVIDKHSSVGARTMLGPYTGIVNSKIDNDVVLEECRVIDTYVCEQNRLKNYLLKQTVIPEGRFR